MVFENCLKCTNNRAQRLLVDCIVWKNMFFPICVYYECEFEFYIAWFVYATEIYCAVCNFDVQKESESCLSTQCSILVLLSLKFLAISKMV